MKYRSLLFASAFIAAAPALAAPQAKSRLLSWAPPRLENPETIQLKDRSSYGLKLKTDRDYVIKLPADRPFVGELNVYGGRNVVIIGGEIRIPGGDEDPEYAEGKKKSKRAVYLHGQKGTIHVEGIHITGKGLHEGFNLDERDPNCVVQLQNIRVERLQGSYSKNHADVIQTWAGPKVLRIDGLTGISDYQGFFLLPNQHFKVKDGAFKPDGWDFRNINLLGDPEKSAYMLWAPGGDTAISVAVDNVWARPATAKKGDRDAYLWPKRGEKGSETWDKVKEGVPPGGDFVPEGLPGINYKSPGYCAN